MVSFRSGRSADRCAIQPGLAGRTGTA